MSLMTGIALAVPSRSKYRNPTLRQFEGAVRMHYNPPPPLTPSWHAVQAREFMFKDLESRHPRAALRRHQGWLLAIQDAVEAEVRGR